MHSFIVAQADGIVAFSSALFILTAVLNALNDFRPKSPNKTDTRSAARKSLTALCLIVLPIVFAGFYVYAASYASPRMNAVFGFTSLFCILTLTIRRGLKAGSLKGYSYAGICVAVLVVAAILTAFLPAK